MSDQKETKADILLERLEQLQAKLDAKKQPAWDRFRAYLAKNNTVENIVIVIATLLISELLHEVTGRKIIFPVIQAVIGG